MQNFELISMAIGQDLIPATVINSHTAIASLQYEDPQIDCSVNFTSEQVAEFWAGYLYYNP